MQGESDGWYCAARREITRATSEGSSRSRGRAALAELRKQESPTGLPGVSADVAWRADGIWKARRGCFGGLQGGPRRGRSPITGPALPPAAQAARMKNREKVFVPAGHVFSSRRASPFSHFPAAQASPYIFPVTSTDCQGRPYVPRSFRKGSGSNCSIFHTPGLRHTPSATILEPIMAGTPVV